MVALMRERNQITMGRNRGATWRGAQMCGTIGVLKVRAVRRRGCTRSGKQRQVGRQQVEPGLKKARSRFVSRC